MDKKSVEAALDALSKVHVKRKFPQSIDFIVCLKELDIKKPEHQIEFFAPLTYPRGKQVKICGLVGGELIEEAKRVFGRAIISEDFDKFVQNPKDAKKLAEEYDFFVAQANIMNKVATAFGKVFGPRGKMPNPKAGCVVAPKSSLAPVAEKLQKVVHVNLKKGGSFQCAIGVEGGNQEQMITNILALYDQLIHHLPSENNNIRKMYLKYTMSKPVVLA